MVNTDRMVDPSTIMTILSILESLEGFVPKEIDEKQAEKIERKTRKIEDILNYNELNERDIKKIKRTLKDIRGDAKSKGIKDSQVNRLNGAFKNNFKELVKLSFDISEELLGEIEQRLNNLKKFIR